MGPQGVIAPLRERLQGRGAGHGAPARDRDRIRRPMPPRPTILVSLIAAMAIGVMLGIHAYWSLRADLPAPVGAMLPIVLKTVRDSYVEPIGEDELVERAILGILGGLDPHSAYLEVSEVELLQEEGAGHFGGIGVEIGFVAGRIAVIAPIAGTPAADAGLKAGDAIVEVDGRPLKGRTVRDAAADLRGAPGTRLTLRIRRAGEPHPLDVDLVREAIPIRTVRSRLLAPGHGYLRIAEFQRQTPADVRAAVAALAEEAGGTLRGLVLDLRDNPGGILGAAVDVADCFLTHGLIVHTEGREAASEGRFTASGEDVLAGAPLAVLINGRSASASEVVAAALKHHGRAVLLGTPSFGKGSVQTVLPLANRRALKLTTAHYYTPDGRSLGESGIEPDVLVPRAAGTERGDYDGRLIARALRELGAGA